MFPEKTKILVIDDMAAMRLRVVNQLKKMGYTNIEEAENGELGYNKLEENNKNLKPFDLVLSDWNMPVMTGIDLLKKIRGIYHFKDLPFLMVTAEGEQDQVINAIKSGVSDYVIKPVAPDALKEKLERVWKKHNPEG